MQRPQKSCVADAGAAARRDRSKVATTNPIHVLLYTVRRYDMNQNTTRTPFDGRILMLGCGSVGQCALPLVRRHIDMPADRITIMDFEDVRPKIEEALQAGVQFKRARLTRENYSATLGELVGPGDLIIDLSWNVETYD